MKTVLTLALMLSGLLTHADVRGDLPPRDEVLWFALRGLRGRAADRIVTRAVIPTFGTLMATAGATWIAARLKVIPARVLGIGSVDAAMVTYFGSTLGMALFVSALHKRRAGRWIPENAAQYQAAMSGLQIEGEYIDAMRAFLKLPLKQQYETATGDPQLRDYLVQLEDWMRGGATGGAPPRQPAGLVPIK